MSKFLITGGAGFIGGNYLNTMVKKYPNDNFVCYDALTYAGNLLTIESIKECKNFIFVHGDICDREKINDLFKSECFDFVINFAAETHVDNSINNPSAFLMTNVIGTEVLLDACLKYGIKRFHQVSTDEVYGDLPLDDLSATFSELSPIKPSSPYSASKASADLIVMAYYRTYGLSVSISRCSNNYGPYQYPEKLIPLLIKNALKDESLPIYGNGLNVRDWLFVDDHCSAVDLIVRNGKSGEIYNIGGHNEHSNIEIANMIIESLGKSETLIKYVKDRLGHDLRYAIDPSKIENELNWKPLYNFKDAIFDVIRWYVDNASWVDSVQNKK
ncbi:MAG: dTDP-glucose 4,6-dehydratase [Bacilli bacterium]